MPPQVEEFLPQQQPQSDIDRRVNELSSTVDALSCQVSNLQIAMQEMKQIVEQSQSNQRVAELSSTVEELRRQLSNMRNEMQQQTARHEKEISLWKEICKHSTQHQQQTSDRILDELRRKILQERRSEINRRKLNKYNSTSSPSSSESNSENEKKGSQLASDFFQNTSKNQQKLSSSSSDEGERLQQDCPPKVSNPWWVSPVTTNVSDKIRNEKPKIDQGSNCLCKTNPYLQSMITGLEKNKCALCQAPKNPQKKKSLSMTKDEQEQFNLKSEKAMDASLAFLDDMNIWN